MQNYIKTIINAIKTWTTEQVFKTQKSLERENKKLSAAINTNNIEIKKAQETADAAIEQIGNIKTVKVIAKPENNSNGAYNVYKQCWDAYNANTNLILVFDIYDHNKTEYQLLSFESDSETFTFINTDQTDMTFNQVIVTPTRVHGSSVLLDKRWLAMNNPTGAGSFSMNRKSNSEVGTNSTTIGNNNIASGNSSFASGYYTEAKGDNSHAQGLRCVAYGYNSYAEGKYTLAHNACTHAEGKYNKSSAVYDLYLYSNDMLSGKATDPITYSMTYTVNQTTGEISLGETFTVVRSAVPIGAYTNVSADGLSVHLVNSKTTHSATSSYRLITTLCKSSKTESYGKYAHIVGNGTGTDARSNAHTLDWNGNAWYAGDVYVGSTSGTNRDEGSNRLLRTDEIATNEDTMDLMAELGYVTPVTSSDGSIYANANGEIYSL